MVNRYVMKSEHDLFIDCLPYEWRSGTSDGLFLPIYLRESWIRGCPDSRTIPSAGLLDYEDTRLKTSSRVRMGLSLAWKASLAIRICRSPTIVTDSV